MLEIGTNLLAQTAEQTRKLTDVETQVLEAEIFLLQHCYRQKYSVLLKVLV